MKYLYQELDELLQAIKYSDEDELDNLRDDLYFEDVIGICKEITESI